MCIAPTSVSVSEICLVWYKILRLLTHLRWGKCCNILRNANSMYHFTIRTVNLSSRGDQRKIALSKAQTHTSRHCDLARCAARFVQRQLRVVSAGSPRHGVGVVSQWSKSAWVMASDPMCIVCGWGDLQWAHVSMLCFSLCVAHVLQTPCPCQYADDCRREPWVFEKLNGCCEVAHRQTRTRHPHVGGMSLSLALSC